MRRTEIERRFDEIIAFAEIERFIDTPVKRYSSGMYVRLAFAVAAHLNPEILLIDEVLAVGDTEFRKKCLGKMGEVAEEGRTVLFVSHNMLAVHQLCHRAIWLHKGKLKEDGDLDLVISHYLDTSSSNSTEQKWEDINQAPGNEQVRLHRACVRRINGSSSDIITIQTPFVMEFDFWNLIPSDYLYIKLSLLNQEGIHIFRTGTLWDPINEETGFPVGLLRSVCHVPGDLLNNGTYRVFLRVFKSETNVVYHWDDVLIFEIREAFEIRRTTNKWGGIIRPNLRWQNTFTQDDIPVKSIPLFSTND